MNLSIVFVRVNQFIESSNLTELTCVCFADCNFDDQRLLSHYRNWLNRAQTSTKYFLRVRTSSRHYHT